MRTTRHFVWIAALVGVLAGPTLAGDCTEGVDWSTRVVCAKGVGGVNPKQPQGAARAGAIRAAQMTAVRNALEMVKGIPISSSTTVAGSMASDDKVRTRIEGYVKGVQLGQPHYMDDMSIEIFAKISLDSIFEQLMAKTWGPPAPVAGPAEVPGAKEIQPLSPLFAAGAVTGLIVDARGLHALPALAPRLLREDGTSLYGSESVSRDWVSKQGMVGYAKSVDAARALEDRVGAQPLVVKAVRVEGLTKTDLVLEKGDAERVKTSAQSAAFLTEGRVIFVVD